MGTSVESTTVHGADWTWVDLPAYNGKESLPVVDSMLIAGYNLVSAKCKNPEAVAKLINLFYDIYYNDDAQSLYGDGVLPSNGFYYQFVPVKLWDGMSSAAEFHRVHDVFASLYENGLNDRSMFRNGLSQALTAAQVQEYEARYASGGGRLYLISSSGGNDYYLNPTVVETIYADDDLKEAFLSMRNREKILHFAQGYPYYVAYKQGISVTDMEKEERAGWGIYHEMIDGDGSYAYVVSLAEGKKQAKYDEFYGTALSAMTKKGEYITTQTGIYFTKMISGEFAMTSFADFVRVYNKNGGNAILKQVKAWYAAEHADAQ